MTLRKLAAVTLNRIFRNHTYTVRHGLAKGLKRRGGLSFLPSVIAAVPKRAREEAFLLTLQLDGQTVFDVGGDQGIYTLFFASRVGERGRVVTYEPNPESHRRIVANVELNEFRNVEVRQLALGARQGRLVLVFPAGDPGRGSADPSYQAQILRERDSRTIEVEVVSLDSEIAASALPQPDLVKIDVEGLDMDVLRGMKETLRGHRPALFIELHGADVQLKEANIRQVVSCLVDARYSVFHVESAQQISLANASMARQGHLYCKPLRV